MQLMNYIRLPHRQRGKYATQGVDFMPKCVSLCVVFGWVVVHQCGEEERTLQQYWYTSWPDQKTPDKAPPLLELVQEVERAREEALPSSGPIIVHCR